MNNNICKYCENPFLKDQIIKKLHFGKYQNCHLECYKYNRISILTCCFTSFLSGIFIFYIIIDLILSPKEKKLTRSQIRQIPIGICPYCQKTISDNERIKKLFLTKGKISHFRCYKNNPHWSWYEVLAWILGFLISLILIILICLQYIN